MQDVVQEVWGLGGGAMRFHRNMHVMALTADAGLRLKVGKMCVVLSLSPSPFLTSVKKNFYMLTAFFFTDVMLCTSVTRIIMTIAIRAVMLGVGHSDITDEGDKKSFGIPKIFRGFHQNKTRSSFSRAPRSGMVHSGQNTYCAERTS